MVVRCCNNGADEPYGFTPDECHTGKTWQEAREICQSIVHQKVNKLDLCTVEQLNAGMTNHTGCGFDYFWTWALDECEK